MLIAFAGHGETDTEEIPEIILIGFAGVSETGKPLFEDGSWTIWPSCFSALLVLRKSLGSPRLSV